MKKLFIAVAALGLVACENTEVPEPVDPPAGVDADSVPCGSDDPNAEPCD